MKYKDYLILPMFLMAVLFASCALIKNDQEYSSTNMPLASVNPKEISWGYDETGFGEYWYADGIRGSECFSVRSSENGNAEIVFLDSRKDPDNHSRIGVEYKVDDMHLLCRNGRRDYDFVFIDNMTAYDMNSCTYYQRADYNKLNSVIVSGKFVNETNSNDWYIFKESGKSIEYFGDMAFPGRWRLSTTDTMTVYDNRCKEEFVFDILFANDGNMIGFDFDGVRYLLST